MSKGRGTRETDIMPTARAAASEQTSNNCWISQRTTADLDRPVPVGILRRARESTSILLEKGRGHGAAVGCPGGLVAVVVLVGARWWLRPLGVRHRHRL